MTSVRRPALLLAASVLMAATTACAPSESDVPTSGSRLEPSFEAKGKAQRERAEKPARSKPGSKGSGAAGGTTPAADPSGSPTGSATGSGGGGAGGAGSGSGGGTAPATSASVTDPTGDVSGLGGSDFVDLTGATLTRDGDRYRLVVETAGTLPSAQEGERTMNVVGFVDTDLDSQVDYEVWASLSDTGWGTSSRNPDGARFGDDSGVDVAVSGSTLTFSFAAPVIGGTDRFQWSVASEHGTYEQVASGTTAQDFGPDRGAVAFPG